MLRALLALLLAVLARLRAKTRVVGSRQNSAERPWGASASSRESRRRISSLSRQLAAEKSIHSFGLLNRLASQSYTHVGARELPSLDSITYAYTPNGSLQTVIETKTTAAGPQLEQTTRGFDALERITSQTRDYGSTQKTTLFGYDTKGNRTSVTDFTGASTIYSFDSVDRLKTATTPNGIATHVYFADGLLQRTEYRASAGAPVTTVEKRCYDSASRLTTVASGPPNFMGDDCPATMGPVVFSRFDYGLDANGNRVTQREQRASTDELTDYGYDALDRLVAVAYPSETVLYQLDAVGNRTGEKKTTRAAVQALGLVAAAFAALAPADTLANVRGDFNRADWLTARRTLSANGLSELSRIDFAHDANGNTTSEHSATSLREYKWDSRNTLTAALIDGLDVGRYSYDWQLQRVSRTAGGSTVEYVLDDKLVLQELDGTHAATRRYHFGALSPLGVSDSAGPRWLLNDGLGSVSDEVTPSGALFKQRQYNAWGEYRNSTAPALNEPKLGYEGHQYDNETGLTYARARYLDNRYGVWLSPDPVGSNEQRLRDPLQGAPFLYAKGNPLRFVDPDGRDALEFLKWLSSPTPNPTVGQRESGELFRSGARTAGQAAEFATGATLGVGAGIPMGLACAYAPHLCGLLLMGGALSSGQPTITQPIEMAKQCSPGSSSADPGACGFNITSTATAFVVGGGVSRGRPAAAISGDVAQAVEGRGIVGPVVEPAPLSAIEQGKVFVTDVSQPEQLISMASKRGSGLRSIDKPEPANPFANRPPDSPYYTPYDPMKPGGPDPARTVDSMLFQNPEGYNAAGFPRDAAEFWRLWAEKNPGVLSETNQSLLEGINPKTGAPLERPMSPRVDAPWIKAYPEHAPYKGDVLIHHHIGGGQQTMPTPGRTHVGSGGPLHGFPLEEP